MANQWHSERFIVADGQTGWEVWEYALPGFRGSYKVRAHGLDEGEADKICNRLTAEAATKH